MHVECENYNNIVPICGYAINQFSTGTYVNACFDLSYIHITYRMNRKLGNIK